MRVSHWVTFANAVVATVLTVQSRLPWMLGLGELGASELGPGELGPGELDRLPNPADALSGSGR